MLTYVEYRAVSGVFRTIDPLSTRRVCPPPPHQFSLFTGNFKQSSGARNRVGIGLLYRPAWARMFKLQGAQESIPRGGINSASLCSLTGQYDKLYDFSFPRPHRLFKNSRTGYTVHMLVELTYVTLSLIPCDLNLCQIVNTVHKLRYINFYSKH